MNTLALRDAVARAGVAAFALVLVCWWPPLAYGQGSGPTLPVVHTTQTAGDGKTPSTYDKVWQWFTEWYRNDRNRVVQRVLFSGRYQHEFLTLHADQGDHDEWNVRRMRLGPRITLFRKLTLHAEAELNPQERDPFYVRLTDSYVQWNQSRRFAVTVGKQGVPFTLEGATSSRELITIDRSNLANNIWFPQEYMPGVSISGRQGPWLYRTGVYSSGAMNREFGEFNGGMFGLGVVGYDFAKALDVEEALLIGNYLYQHPDANNTFTRQLEHVGSMNFRFEDDRWGVHADLSAASGYLGQSDLWGLMAMPFLNITEKLQLVGRYSFLHSDSANGLRLNTYESRVESGRGDRYGEWYGGLNYFFYGHRLKFQTGVQHASMDDRASDGGEYSGVAWTTGIRVGW
jgi:phosphate-selective porin OprO/OprP